MSPTTIAAPANATELAGLLRAGTAPLRVTGSGSRQHRLPPPPPGAARLELHRLDAIVRLDAGDHTCVVECGVRREQLDAAAGAAGLELPCAGGGTIGGLFASDPCGPRTFGGPGPRSLLLGVDALLANGTAFRAGARVVKSVAGYDVHKLLVGSEGRLFVAMRLCLRLVPRPRARTWFAQRALELPEALALLAALRAGAVAPGAVQLAREPAGYVVRGCIDGRASFVAATVRAQGLSETAPAWCDHLEPAPGGEVVAGLALGSALPALVASLPDGAPLVWHGGGRFEAGLPDPAATDALLAALPRHGLHARIVCGAPARRGAGTPVDPGQQRLAEGLRAALDPDGLLV